MTLSFINLPLGYVLVSDFSLKGCLNMKKTDTNVSGEKGSPMIFLYLKDYFSYCSDYSSAKIYGMLSSFKAKCILKFP